MRRSAGSEQQHDLFPSHALPEGFAYEREFLTMREEAELLGAVQALPLQEAQYREWTARRRIASFGGRYDFTHHELLPAPDIPSFLWPLREKVAAWSGIPAAEFGHAMVSEYQPGTPLGWHRDVPEFEAIVGVSLAGAARMRLRRYPPAKGDRSSLALRVEPRSVYAMRGEARWNWQHAISPTKQLRYSITFRTRRTPNLSQRAGRGVSS
jgi:alkylated DNA repair dioxygenase AlkB